MRRHEAPRTDQQVKGWEIAGESSGVSSERWMGYEYKMRKIVAWSCDIDRGQKQNRTEQEVELACCGDAEREGKGRWASDRQVRGRNGDRDGWW